MTKINIWSDIKFFLTWFCFGFIGVRTHDTITIVCAVAGILLVTWMWIEE